MLNIATNNTIYSATNYIILFKLNEYMYSILGVILIHFHFDGSRKLKDLTVVFVFSHNPYKNLHHACQNTQNFWREAIQLRISSLPKIFKNFHCVFSVATETLTVYCITNIVK